MAADSKLIKQNGEESKRNDENKEMKYGCKQLVGRRTDRPLQIRWVGPKVYHRPVDIAALGDSWCWQFCWILTDFFSQRGGGGAILRNSHSGEVHIVNRIFMCTKKNYEYERHLKIPWHYVRRCLQKNKTDCLSKAQDKKALFNTAQTILFQSGLSKVNQLKIPLSCSTLPKILNHSPLKILDKLEKSKKPQKKCSSCFRLLQGQCSHRANFAI